MMKFFVLLSLLFFLNAELYSREKYEELTSKATFETLDYETYLEVFRNKQEMKGPQEKLSERLKEQIQSSKDNFESDEKQFLALKTAITLPPAFSWKTIKPECFTTPIKDQANCGSCFSMAATFALAKRFCVNKYPYDPAFNLDLSPQDLLECTSNHKGCEGGGSRATAKSLEDYGVCTEGCKRYTSGNLGFIPSCSPYCDKFSNVYKKYKAKKNSLKFYKGNYQQLKEDLYLWGPMVADMRVYQDFSTYKGGIYEHKWGEPTELHDITLIGWGVDGNGRKYWTLANSWGPKWGENGYFNIYEGQTDICDEAVSLDPQY